MEAVDHKKRKEDETFWMHSRLLIKYARDDMNNNVLKKQAISQSNS